mmetsp:Transcript_12592/g.27830  ORF Transcript_12592/g.27830 Transcript_12592/m.27830 type:complete len:321 (-) Transcript_12592:323-1285(-)
MANEDFPALPGAPPGSSLLSVPGVGSQIIGSNDVQRDSTGSIGGSYGAGPNSHSRSSNPLSFISSNNQSVGDGGLNELYGGGGSEGQSSSGRHGSSSEPSLDIGGPFSSNDRNLNSSLQSISIPSRSSNQQSGSSSSGSGSTLNGDYGLLGLLGVIRMSDADRNALALGSDLTALGLNLNTNDFLYSTFSGPWAEGPTNREPQYQLPMCYYMQPPALKTGHLSKFQLETLFYIFYALPKDVLQAYAAQELYTREWRYHVELKLWFKRAGLVDGVSNSNGTQYIYFDIHSWERRLFNGNMHQNITSGFLSEDEVRVKFSTS